MSRIDISDDMTPTFYVDYKIRKGSVLTFMQDGQKHDYKIVRLNRSKHICVVEPTKLYTEDEINAMDRAEAEEIIKHG